MFESYRSTTIAIASITKSVVAAQAMLMVEAGDLRLDDLVTDHVPQDLQFDTNGATIRHLLGHRSGLPDYYELGPLERIQWTDFQRVFTPTELLELVPTERTPPGSTFSYAETNYNLPSLANATAYNASGGIASDSRSLARWWRALCAGEIVSQASLTEMSTFQPAAFIGSYGLGVYNPANGYASAFGHTGQLPGYMSWAACLPEDEAVIVVLTNHEVDDGHLAFSHGLARPLVDARRSD